jgi:hypothetical protein
MRLSKRIVRKPGGALPSRRRLLKEARILRQRHPNDPKINAVIDAFISVDNAIFGDDGTVRRGGPDEPRRAPLHEAWDGKEPPER